ncbi:MAG: hypothetical protein IJM50_06930 [Lachnospiraceae bacterium]|nr:hypothetical protein [Lachnospiraceae bacterium]
MEKKEIRLIKCPNCGADHDIHLPKCPYCGFLNPEGAEEQYLSGLKKTQDDLDKVDDIAAENVKTEVKDSAKAVGKKLIVIGAVILLIGLAVFLVNKLSSCSDKSYELTEKEMRWQREVFPQLDALYDAGSYRAAAERIYEYGAKDHRVWDWKHYEFISWYGRYEEVQKDVMELNAAGTCSESLAGMLVYDTFGFYFRDYEASYNQISREEKDILDQYREEVVRIIRERMGFSDEKMDELKKTVYDEYGVLRVKGCEEIAKEYHGQFR